MITVYGIKSCTTMKKAFAWFDAHKVTYVLHDYKKSGADVALVGRLIAEYRWENVINRKGLTWRGLGDAEKKSMNEKSALKAALKNPSLLRRPIITGGAKIVFGFDEGEYEKSFLKK